ncbi:DUF427 domain-containing protein [Nocardioides rubriscoriae]|uniref:DUF427 domain-containing protein n=1 Tax=Nocardioides rubriscoriae TaxID=642762 RepID=UPI0011DF5611|nr:DUF427 domain-containing protein [Nocardioides rubriscoriae]
MAAAKGRVEPCPRRVRAWLGGELVVDTTAARYGWEFPFYPQLYLPWSDVTPGVLVDEDREMPTPFGRARRHALRADGQVRPHAARVHDLDVDSPVAGTVRLDWKALDTWFEEDEEVFVHPRNPYVRVDALRSRRHVRVSLDGVTLAETSTPVMLIGTGLPARTYVPRTDVAWEHLVATDTVSECPYKGTTSGYWSTASHQDVAWSYQFPTLAVALIAGLVAFYDERVDTWVDGVLQARPRTRHV